MTTTYLWVGFSEKDGSVGIVSCNRLSKSMAPPPATKRKKRSAYRERWWSKLRPICFIQDDNYPFLRCNAWLRDLPTSKFYFLWSTWYRMTVMWSADNLTLLLVHLILSISARHRHFPMLERTITWENKEVPHSNIGLCHTRVRYGGGLMQHYHTSMMPRKAATLL